MNVPTHRLPQLTKLARLCNDVTNRTHALLVRTYCRCSLKVIIPWYSKWPTKGNPINSSHQTNSLWGCLRHIYLCYIVHMLENTFCLILCSPNKSHWLEYFGFITVFKRWALIKRSQRSGFLQQSWSHLEQSYLTSSIALLSFNPIIISSLRLSKLYCGCLKPWDML